MATVQYIMFKLGEQDYTMKLSYIKGIEQNYSVMPIPGGPEHIQGLINLRGDIVPIYSLRDKFGIYGECDLVDKKILVTFAHNTLLAFEVDAVIGIENVNTDDVKGVPKVVIDEDTNYIENVVKTNDKIVIAISVNNILSESELDELDKMIDENK